MEYIDRLVIIEDGDDDDNGVKNFEKSEETSPTDSGCSKPPLWEPAPDWCNCRHC